MKKYILLLNVCLLLNWSVFAQQNFTGYLKDNTTYREHSLDITKMSLAVSFLPEQGLVLGKVTHSFVVLQKKVDSVFFDAPGIQIKKVLLNGKPVDYSINNQGVWIKPAVALSWEHTGNVFFEYEASPRRGIYFIGWNSPEPAEPNPFAVRKQIWTQGQGIDNRQWIPMYDDMNDKFITETSITFNQDYQVISNGLLTKKVENKQQKTITWNYAMSKPHAGYLLMLAIGKYAVHQTKSMNGVPLQYWYYPEFADRMEPTYRYTPYMMDFLERETGVKYPWETYSQVMVQDFIFGAMENTTATIFGDFFNVDKRAFLDRNYIGVNCHEMTHQWFGDFITARDGRDAWLQESFATYFPKQLSKELDGIEEWDWQRRAHQNAAVEAGKKDNFPVRHSAGGTARVYPKGASVISMLAYVLGQEEWKKVLTYYLNKHAYANVETNDLQQAIKDKLGLNLDWFFDEWIARGGEPHYKVQYQNLVANNNEMFTEVTIEQIHKTTETIQYFQMPIVVEVHYENGTFNSVKFMQSNAFDRIRIPNPLKQKIAFVLFDPNSNITKQVTFNKSFEELLKQSAGASNYLDRYDAIFAMKQIPIEQKRVALLAALKKEKHDGIINEIVSQLANDNDAESIAALKGLLSYNQKASTREAVIKSIRSLDESWKNTCINHLTDSSYEVIKAAMDKLVQFSFDVPTMKLVIEKTNNTLGMNNAIAIKRAEIMFLSHQIDNKQFDRDLAIQTLQNFGSNSYEFRTNLLAFNAIKNTNYLDEKMANHIFKAMLSTNNRLANPAAELANHFAAQFAYKNLFKTQFLKSNFSQTQKTIIKGYLSWIE
jgi:aminopeptidase N